MTLQKLNLGCGKDIREGYLNLDINPVDDTVIKHDVANLQDFADSSVSELLAYDIIEHFPLEKVNQIIKEWCRVIAPGGKIIIKTPDIEVIFDEYYKQAQDGEITWARLSRIIHGIDEPFQTHYVSLSFPWLKDILEQFDMTDFKKTTQDQNMIVEAAKKSESDIQIDRQKASEVREMKVINSGFCKIRLKSIRYLREMCRRHRLIRSLRFNKVCEAFIKVLQFKPAGPIVVPTKYGYEIIVDPTIDKGLETAIFNKGAYEEGTLHVIGKVLRRGDTFIDIGSNIGLMTLFAATAVGPEGRVYAFEPEPDTFVILNRNIELNSLQNVLANNFALGSAESTETISREADNRGSATLLGAMGNTTPSRQVSVKTLDSFVKDQVDCQVRMIKIDVEGWELEVLNGAGEFLSSPDAPAICIEYSNIHQTHGGCQIDIYNKICSLNDYRIFKLEHGKGSPGKLIEVKGPQDLPAHDNLFCLLEKHISEIDPGTFKTVSN